MTSEQPTVPQPNHGGFDIIGLISYNNDDHCDSLPKATMILLGSVERSSKAESLRSLELHLIILFPYYIRSQRCDLEAPLQRLYLIHAVQR